MSATTPSTSGTDVDDLFVRFHETGDPTLRNRLVEEFLPVADRCARRYANRGEPLADLTQVARTALVRAVDRFDPHRGLGFEGYAIPTIVGEIRHHFRDHCWMLSVPRKSKELRSRIFDAGERLGQQLGRLPTTAELAAVLEIDEQQVSTTIEVNRHFRARSWEEIGESGDHAPTSSDDSPEEDALDRLDLALILGCLDERSRKIVTWRFWEECTQREIGARLGIGQVQVSRLLARALTTMRAANGGTRAA